MSDTSRVVAPAARERPWGNLRLSAASFLTSEHGFATALIGFGVATTLVEAGEAWHRAHRVRQRLMLLKPWHHIALMGHGKRSGKHA